MNIHYDYYKNGELIKFPNKIEAHNSTTDEIRKWGIEDCFSSITQNENPEINPDIINFISNDIGNVKYSLKLDFLQKLINYLDTDNEEILCSLKTIFSHYIHNSGFLVPLIENNFTQKIINLFPSELSISLICDLVSTLEGRKSILEAGILNIITEKQNDLSPISLLKICCNLFKDEFYFYDYIEESKKLTEVFIFLLDTDDQEVFLSCTKCLFRFVRSNIEFIYEFMKYDYINKLTSIKIYEGKSNKYILYVIKILHCISYSGSAGSQYLFKNQIHQYILENLTNKQSSYYVIYSLKTLSMILIDNTDLLHFLFDNDVVTSITSWVKNGDEENVSVLEQLTIFLSDILIVIDGIENPEIRMPLLIRAATLGYFSLLVKFWKNVTDGYLLDYMYAILAVTKLPRDINYENLLDEMSNDNDFIEFIENVKYDGDQKEMSYASLVLDIVQTKNETSE